MNTPDGYVVAANTKVYTTPTGFTSLTRQTINKFDNQGQLMWERTFPGDALSADMRLQSNGAYVAAGYVGVRTPLTTSSYYSLDWRLVEFTHRGDTLRTKRFGVEGDFDNALRLIATADKGVAVLTEYEPRLNPNAYVQRLVKLDSLWRVQWQATLPPNATFTDLSQTRTGELLLLAGAGTTISQTQVYRYTAAGQLLRSYGPFGLPNAAYRGALPNRLVHEPGDSLMVWGSAFTYDSPARTTYLQRFYGTGIGGAGTAAVGAPFVPDYCRYPPRPVLGYQPRTAAAPDSLVLTEFSGAGPRYAQNVVFRWSLGDGTVRETSTGGTFRYRYATVPPAGTAVTLTVINNLGCAGSVTVYPFGLPTAAQQGHALAGRASLYPNPAADAATLTLAQAPPGPLAVEVLNAVGQVVLRPAVPAPTSSLTLALDLRGLPPGVYAVRVHTSAGSFSKRLVRY